MALRCKRLLLDGARESADGGVHALRLWRGSRRFDAGAVADDEAMREQPVATRSPKGIPLPAAEQKISRSRRNVLGHCRQFVAVGDVHHGNALQKKQTCSVGQLTAESGDQGGSQAYFEQTMSSGFLRGGYGSALWAAPVSCVCQVGLPKVALL